jgi:NADH-quinone oxidoreductase subunit G
MSDDTIKIEVDGQEIEARKGSMLIEATDAAGVYIPRFCYHKHLSVAANCRMCLVEVERAPKPLPACATPVMDGMKVFTRSEKAVAAQHATMEFLLINHPLDCPICDQGGECELQDLAMGYGSGVSQFSERKRVVRDKDIGPLVQTDMTRCIHCTRCVRFGEEVAGLRELGATGRGEHMEIGTYIQKAMSSELSGNVIDLCPVGALTNKPYRYSARAWELQQYDGIAPHDGLGSALHFHARGKTIKRVIPAENAAINEVWLSDRDRYSYEGLNHAARLQQPRVKRDGRWADCDWDTALGLVSDNLRKAAAGAPEQIAALASPSSTTEEFYLLQRLLRELGSHNVDHRLRQRDFCDQQSDPLYPSAPALADLENADAILLVGAYPRHEQPLLNLRLRKAALRGASVMTLDTHQRPFNYATGTRKLIKPSEFVAAMATLLRNLAQAKNVDVAAPLDKIVASNAVDDADITTIAERLQSAESSVVLFGAAVEQHPMRSVLVQLGDMAAQLGGAACGFLASGANSAGACLAGAVPHRGPVGRVLENPGLSVVQIASQPRDVVLLLGVDPALDCAAGAEMKRALAVSKCVVAINGYHNPTLEEVADVMLPMALFAENEGSYVNLNGIWQAFSAAVKPQGEARPAWKILRVIGHQLELPGFDAVECGDVTAEIKALTGVVKPAVRGTPTLESNALTIDASQFELIVDIPMYAGDELVRHAEALQQMPQSGDDRLRLNSASLDRLGLQAGSVVEVKVGDATALMELALDDGIATGACVVAGARKTTADIAVDGASVNITLARGTAAA